MSNWLSKAANVFKREVSETPQPFDIVCDCGQRHAGLRRQVHQHLVCKSCGTSLFVLPRDVYPTPPPETPKSPAMAPPVTDGGEIPDGSVIPASPPRPSAPKRKRRQAEISEPWIGPAPISPKRSAEKPPQASGKKPLARPATKSKPAMDRPAPRRFWTPFRIVTLSVLAIIFFTSWWTVRQSLLSRAVRVAQQEGELGLEAVKQKEWLKARDHLELATAALDRLGRNDPEAEAVRQYYRELRAILRPCTIPLVDLIQKAQSDYESRDEQKRSPRNLARSYRGEWLIVEGQVRSLTREEAGGQRGAFALSLPWSPDGSGGGVILRADFPVFSKEMSPGEEKFAVFAGAIDECVWDSERQAWVVYLDPDSGFLWAHPDSYLAAGFEYTPLRTQAKVVAELGQQAQLMGLTP